MTRIGVPLAVTLELSELIISTAVLMGVFLFGAIAVALANRWRKRDKGPGLTASDQLAEFRSLYLEGVISKEEFDQLKAKLGGQLRKAFPTPKETGMKEASPSPLPSPKKEGIQKPETPPNGEALA